MTPIKVLQLTEVEVDDYNLKNMSESLEGSEIDFSFVTLGASDSDLVRGATSRGRKAIGLNALRRSSYPRAYRELARIFREIDPDIVHTNLFDASLMGLTIAKSQGRKTVLTRHHSDALYKIASTAKRKVYLSLERYVSRKADHIIAPSQMVRDILVDIEKVPSEKVSVIPYAQTSDRFSEVTPETVKAKRSELGMDDQLSLICVSRLYHGKGHRYLFEAFASLVDDGLDARLYLVGSGDYQSELERIAKELRITDRVEFLGYRNDTLEIIAAADIIVHPSLEDALSQALIESLMLGRPIVATDISGAADTLHGGDYGRLVAPADSEALRKGIEETVRDLGGARSRAAMGRDYILTYMNADRVASEYKAIYQKLCKKV